MQGPGKRPNEKDRLLSRPDKPLPAVQDPLKHENPKDPKTPKSEQGSGMNAREIDYTV
jgi:hypothetical protein